MAADSLPALLSRPMLFDSRYCRILCPSAEALETSSQRNGIATRPSEDNLRWRCAPEAGRFAKAPLGARPKETVIGNC